MFKPIHISQILNSEDQELDWLVEDLIPARGLTSLSGDPGSYKTWLLLHIAINASAGKQVFGKFPTKQVNALIIDEENIIGMLKGRLKMLGADAESSVYFLVKQGFKADNSDEMNALLRYIKENNIGLVCIDSLIRIHSKEENEAKQMAQLFQQLSKITALGCTVIFTHHHRKDKQGSKSSQSMRGSSDILASVDCHLMIEESKDDVIKMTHNKLRVAKELPPFNLSVLFDKDSGKISFSFEGDVPPKLNKVEKAKEVILSLLTARSYYREDIVRQLKLVDVGSNNTGEALKALIDEGKISVEGKGKKKLYQLDNGIVAEDTEEDDVFDDDSTF